MPTFNIKHWPEGSEPGMWMPVAQLVTAPGMRQAVEETNPGPGRYMVEIEGEPRQPPGFVVVDPDGTARDVDVVN